MVKIKHKRTKNANLRQAIRLNIGNIANIQKNIWQHLSNLYNSVKFSDISLTFQTNDTSEFLSHDIQDINTPNILSYNNIQYKNLLNNYENNSEASDNDQETYFQESDECEDNDE